jgi:hypothetical protein
MRNMTGAVKARVLSEMYREKPAGTDSTTSRMARPWLDRGTDHDGEAGAGSALEDGEYGAR